MRDQLRLLLLQIRNTNDPMRSHEHACFVDVAEVAPEQVVCIDAITQEFLTTPLRDYDALLVGGSGEYSLSKSKAPFLDSMKEFLRDLIDRDYPIFASCFGFQTIAEVLGGEVIADPDNTEVGTFELGLTDEGRDDVLFRELGSPFLVQMGHTDRLERIPEGVDTLARGEVIACQAFRVRGRRVWATQFHPELTAETNRERYLHYIANYTEEGPNKKIMESFRESQPAQRLVARFIDTVLLGGER